MAILGAELMAAFERQVAEDRALHFKGTARVRFESVAFPNPIRPHDPKIIKRLRSDFTKAGCLKHEPNYSIPAIIEDYTLVSELGRLGITEEQFKGSSRGHLPLLQLRSGIRLEGLHGQHRILAGATLLPPSEQWWTVDLYGSGLADKTKQRLREGYYSSNYTDGEIFRQMRMSQLQNDRIGQTRWRGRLSQWKSRDLTALLNRGLLMKALDSVLALAAVWKDFKLGSMDVFSTLRCDEVRRSASRCHSTSTNSCVLQEIAYYIAHIEGTWVRILSDPSLAEFVDEATVNSIQLRAPAVSRVDADFITSNMQSERLFPRIMDPSRRAGILQRLLAIDFPVPSLYTLFRDIRYIEPAVELLKALVPAQNNTVRERLRFHFLCLGENTLQIQQSLHSYTTVTGSQHDLFEIALREMWLCSLRSVSITVGNAPKRDMNPVKRTANAPNYILWFEMAKLADRLGFSSPEITSVLENDPMKEVLREMLCKSIPSQVGQLSGAHIQRLTESVKELLAESTRATDEALTPYITVPGEGVPLLKRCGISPEDSSDTADHNDFFFSKVHAPIAEYRSVGGGLSSFFVKRCRYLAFLGPTTLAEMVGSGITEIPQVIDGTMATRDHTSGQNVTEDFVM